MWASVCVCVSVCISVCVCLSQVTGSQSEQEQTGMNQTEQLPSAGNSNACITTRPPIGCKCDMNYRQRSDWCRFDRPPPTWAQPCGVLRERRRRRRGRGGGGRVSHSDCELQVDLKVSREEMMEVGADRRVDLWNPELFLFSFKTTLCFTVSFFFLKTL